MPFLIVRIYFRWRVGAKNVVMGKTIYILSCTSSKNKKGKTVEELYTGQLFVKGLAYARRHNHDGILVIGGTCKSKVYQLDDDIVFYKGIAISKLKKSDRIKLAKKRLDNILSYGYSAEKDKFVFLTGQSYYEFILAGHPNALPSALQHYETPFRDNHLQGIGEILHFLENN